MLIGIISDTHGHLPPELFLHLDGCDLLLHLGDIGPASLLTDLASIAPVQAVRGNTDDPGRPDLPAALRLNLLGLPLFLRHLPWRSQEIERGLPAVYLHGHTHEPRLEQEDKAWIVCPGSTSRPRGDKPAALLLMNLDESVIQMTHVAVDDGSVLSQAAWPRL